MFFYRTEVRESEVEVWLCSYVQGVAKKWPNLFLSELRQIFTKFDNFWHTDSQDDKTMWGTLIVHVT